VVGLKAAQDHWNVLWQGAPDIAPDFFEKRRRIGHDGPQERIAQSTFAR
jgi:hypothetical protein